MILNTKFIANQDSTKGISFSELLDIYCDNNSLHYEVLETNNGKILKHRTTDIF